MEYTFHPRRASPPQQRRTIGTITTTTTITTTSHHHLPLATSSSPSPSTTRPQLLYQSFTTGDTIPMNLPRRYSTYTMGHTLDTSGGGVLASPTSENGSTTSSSSSSSSATSNPFDRIDEGVVPTAPLPFHVQQLDDAESTEFFDLSPPLQISGHGQMLLWRSCIVHVYKGGDSDTSLGEQFAMCDGKGIVPHGTSVWLCGRRGSVKTRPPLSP